MGRRAIEESPVVLDDGRWVNVRGIQRWVPAPRPELAKPNPPKPDVIACTECNAGPTDPCRRPSGQWVRPHKARTIPKCCPCGAEPGRQRMHCDNCYIEGRRTQWRASAARRRAAGHSVEGTFHSSVGSGRLVIAKDERPQTADRANGQTVVRGLTEPEAKDENG